VTDSVCWAVYAFLRFPDDYWEAIRLAIGVGGDTDTMAAMAGAIAGARVGLAALPTEASRRLTDRGAWGYTELVALCARASGAG
jgi:ADP-ribosylglycohydrolase